MLNLLRKLGLYPKAPAVGDRIIAKIACFPYFDKGATGTILEVGGSHMLLVQFDEGHALDDGQWYIQVHETETVR